jgi:hypothetical protein
MSQAYDKCPHIKRDGKVCNNHKVTANPICGKCTKSLNQSKHVSPNQPPRKRHKSSAQPEDIKQPLPLSTIADTHINSMVLDETTAKRIDKLEHTIKHLTQSINIKLENMYNILNKQGNMISKLQKKSPCITPPRSPPIPYPLPNSQSFQDCLEYVSPPITPIKKTIKKKNHNPP